ncbi:MAG TPA: HNH endonuclease family protein, partial [Pyrinomonadaceae bacterium]
SNAELVTNADTDELNLEHILPQTPAGAWSLIPTEMAQKYYNRLGNLTLMRSKSNSSVGNDSFTSKKQLYAQSDLELTKAISKYNKCGIDEIEERQRRLSALAVKAWSNKIA